MPEGIFIEPKITPEGPVVDPADSRIHKWIISNSRGYIKNAKQADIVLIFVSGLMLLISVYYIFFGGGPDLPAGIKSVPPQGLPLN